MIDFKCFKNNYVIIIFLLTFAFSIRLLHLNQFKKSFLFNTPIIDSISYDQWGMKIAAGADEKKAFYQDPIYPYLLSLVYKIFGHNYYLLFLLQIIIGTFNCLLAYLVTKEIFSSKEALLSLFISACYGPYIFYDSLLLKPFLIVFFISIFLYTLLLSIKKKKKYYYFFSGISLSLGIATRGNLYLWVPASLIWLLFILKEKKWENIFIFLSGIVLILLFFCLRNYFVSGHLILGNSSIGINFYIGNNTNAKGIHTLIPNVMTTPGYEQEDAKKYAVNALKRNLTPSEVSGFWFSKGIDFIIKHPQRYIKLIGEKIFYFWNDYEIGDNYNYSYFKILSNILRLPLITFGQIAPLGIMGIILAHNKDNPFMYILPILLFTYMVTLIIFYVTSRYRIPAVFLLIISSSHSLKKIIEWLKKRDIKKITAFSFAFIPLWIITNRDTGLNKNLLAHSYTISGKILYQKGEKDKAVNFFLKAINLNPEETEALNNIAWRYAENGVKMETALEYAKRSIEKYPENANYHDTLSYVYFISGEHMKSYIEAQKALNLGFVKKDMKK